MTVWSTARAVALLAGVVVLAACGPTVQITTAPGSPTTAIPTPPPVPGGPDGLPTFALPSFTGDAELEALLPDELGGASVETLSMSGDDFLRGAGESAADFVAMLSQSGWSPADLSVALAATDDVVLVAYRNRDVDTNLFFEAFKSRLENAGGATSTDVSFGGKSVTKFVPIDGDTIYVYASGDIVFSIEATDRPGISIDDTDELLNEAFSKLP
jgi:hypothetical protein